MAGELIFRSGKYKGKTLSWVQDNDPSYIVWIEENRPEMLKGPKVKEPTNESVDSEYRYKPLKPNYDFDKPKTNENGSDVKDSL